MIPNGSLKDKERGSVRMEQNYIAVNAARIEESRNKLDQSLISVRDRMQALADKVNVLNQNWQGEANAAFLNTMNEDYQLMAEFLNEVVMFSQVIITAEQEYLSCEEEVQSRIQYMGI